MPARLRSHLTYANVAATIALFGVIGAGAVAIGGVTDGAGNIRACYDKKGPNQGEVRLLVKGKCAKSEKPISWNQTGPAGPAGAPGSAVAYAYIAEDGTVNQSLSKNVTGVLKPFPGNPGFYCIDVAVPVKSVVGQIETGGGPDLSLLASARPDRVELADPNTCPPPFNDAVVVIRTTGNVSTAQEYFVVFN